MSRTLTLPLEEYQQDLATAGFKAKQTVMADMLYVLKMSLKEKDNEEAYFKLKEICPDQTVRNSIMELLGITEVL